jgi:DNA-binding LacI/PurR family transcriptional regulator
MYPGFEAAFHAMGRPVDLHWVKSCSHTDSREARNAMAAWLRLPERPSAIVCHNDTVAMGVIEAAKQAGLNVPGDLSVVGYDNMPGAAELDPPLTTFENRERELGLEAVQVLRDVCEGRDRPARIRRLTCPMVVRDSTAPPARN